MPEGDQQHDFDMGPVGSVDILLETRENAGLDVLRVNRLSGTWALISRFPALLLRPVLLELLDAVRFSWIDSAQFAS